VDQRAHLGQSAFNQDCEPVDEAGEMVLCQSQCALLIIGLNPKADRGELSGAGRAKEVLRFRKPFDECGKVASSLRLKGYWLAGLGFTPGKTVEVITANGLLVIRKRRHRPV
jgi:hypothetical protein